MEARDWLHSQAWLRPWNENGDEPLASIPSPLDLQWLFSGNASFHLDLRQQYGTTVDRTAEVKAVPSPASTLRFLDSDAHSQLAVKVGLLQKAQDEAMPCQHASDRNEALCLPSPSFPSLLLNFGSSCTFHLLPHHIKNSQLGSSFKPCSDCRLLGGSASRRCPNCTRLPWLKLVFPHVCLLLQADSSAVPLPGGSQGSHPSALHKVADVAEMLRKKKGEDEDVPHQHPRQQFSLQDSVDRWHATVGSLGGHAEAVTVVCTADRPLTSSLLNKMVRLHGDARVMCQGVDGETLRATEEWQTAKDEEASLFLRMHRQAQSGRALPLSAALLEELNSMQAKVASTRDAILWRQLYHHLGPH